MPDTHLESYLILKQTITVSHQIWGNQTDDKMIKVDIKWEESFIACCQSDLAEQILKKHLWNTDTQKNMCGGRMYGNTWQQLNKYYSAI